MKKLFTFSLSTLTLSMLSMDALATEEVNVYSYRQPFLVKPIFDAFTKETGIKVNVKFAKSGLIEKIAQEGEYSPADVVLTTDISRMMELTNKGLVQSVTSEY